MLKVDRNRNGLDRPLQGEAGSRVTGLREAIPLGRVIRAGEAAYDRSGLRRSGEGWWSNPRAQGYRPRRGGKEKGRKAERMNSNETSKCRKRA